MADSQPAIRHLNITDLERIERFRRAGYGGSVSDALEGLGVCGTVCVWLAVVPVVSIFVVLET